MDKLKLALFNFITGGILGTLVTFYGMSYLVTHWMQVLGWGIGILVVVIIIVNICTTVSAMFKKKPKKVN
jgi:multisubunit Na+/H+ antiporter MnhE subunit